MQVGKHVLGCTFCSSMSSLHRCTFCSISVCVTNRTWKLKLTISAHFHTQLQARLSSSQAHLLPRLVYDGDVTGTALVGIGQEHVVRHKLHRVQSKLEPLVSDLLGQVEILLSSSQMRETCEFPEGGKRQVNTLWFPQVRHTDSAFMTQMWSVLSLLNHNSVNIYCVIATFHSFKGKISEWHNQPEMFSDVSRLHFIQECSQFTWGSFTQAGVCWSGKPAWNSPIAPVKSLALETHCSQ